MLPIITIFSGNVNVSLIFSVNVQKGVYTRWLRIIEHAQDFNAIEQNTLGSATVSIKPPG